MKCNPITCSKPPKVANASYTLDYKTRKYLTVASYKCNDGYELSKGSINALVCRENRRFGDGILPKCERKSCGVYKCPPNGKFCLKLLK